MLPLVSAGGPQSRLLSPLAGSPNFVTSDVQLYGWIVTTDEAVGAGLFIWKEKIKGDTFLWYSA